LKPNNFGKSKTKRQKRKSSYRDCLANSIWVIPCIIPYLPN